MYFLLKFACSEIVNTLGMENHQGKVATGATTAADAGYLFILGKVSVSQFVLIFAINGFVAWVLLPECLQVSCCCYLLTRHVGFV